MLVLVVDSVVIDGFYEVRDHGLAMVAVDAIYVHTEVAWCRSERGSRAGMLLVHDGVVHFAFHEPNVLTVRVYAGISY
jgi:hypothetical protein